MALGRHGVADVTRRYEERWSVRQKMRQRLFNETELEVVFDHLSRRQSVGEAEHGAADAAFLRSKAESESIPGRVADFKDHPLFVLEKDLLKYQFIHPRISLGKIKEYDIFARSSVHVLKSEQKWLQDQRQIKPNQQPLKMVKKRTKPNTEKQSPYFLPPLPPADGEQPQLGVYGFWQTEPYQPGEVRDGVVPRNRFGNVYLFHPSMLPAGAVHLREMPGLPRIAKKLGISCVTAITGWTIRRRMPTPAEDGFVVPADKAALLTDAWLAAEQGKHAAHVRTIVNRWKTLARQLQIRQAVYARFSKQAPSAAAAPAAVDSKNNGNDDVEVDDQAPIVVVLSEDDQDCIILDD